MPLKPQQNIAEIVALVLAGESIFFLPFVLARIFRPTLLSALDISNLELGAAFSAYGLVAMVSYFFGGPLADRFSTRALIAWALWLTAAGGVVLLYQPSPIVLVGLYAYWGATTILLFWAALIKATRQWGSADLQGRAFGLLEGGRGVAAALIGTAAFVLFAQQMGARSDNKASYQAIVGLTTAMVAAAGIVVWLAMAPNRRTHEKQEQPITWARIKAVVSMPGVWMLGIIIVCAYVGYKVTDDLSLYAHEVLGFTEVNAALVGTIALWLRPVFAVLAGVVADRVRGIHAIIGCFVIMIVGGLYTYAGVLESAWWLVLIALTATVAGVYGVRAIYFAILGDAQVPLAATGTAVGVMSVLGYTPDVFMSPLMGYLLDQYPSPIGHRYVFLVMASFALVGFLTALLFKHTVGKQGVYRSALKK